MTTHKTEEAQTNRPRIVLVNRAIVLNKKRQILLIQRAANDAWLPGYWEVPGGKLDEGQDISDALEREVMEETGLFVIPHHRIAYFESMVLTKGKYTGLPYVVLIGIVYAENEECVLSKEHDKYIWVNYDTAIQYYLTDETKKALIALKKQLFEEE